MGYSAIYTMNINFTSKYGEKEIKMNSYNLINKIIANTEKQKIKFGYFKIFAV